MAWFSRAGLRTMQVAVSVRRQNFVTTASRWFTSITAISKTQLSSPVTLYALMHSVLDQLDHSCVVGATDPHDGPDAIAELRQIDGCTVAGDDTRRLELSHPLRHGRLAQMDASPKLSHRQASIGL